jgi:hypothetical protein
VNDSNSVTAEPVCGATAAQCICDEPPGHDSPHLCKCTGSWLGEFDGDDFEVIALPDPGALAVAESKALPGGAA